MGCKSTGKDIVTTQDLKTLCGYFVGVWQQQKEFSVGVAGLLKIQSSLARSLDNLLGSDLTDRDFHKFVVADPDVKDNWEHVKEVRKSSWHVSESAECQRLDTLLTELTKTDKHGEKRNEIEGDLLSTRGHLTLGELGPLILDHILFIRDAKDKALATATAAQNLK
jgi:hypothetical protein